MLTWSPAVNNFKSKAFTKRCGVRKGALHSLGQQVSLSSIRSWRR